MCVLGVHRGEKASVSLEQKLWMVVSCHSGVRTKPGSPTRATRALNHGAISPDPHGLTFEGMTHLWDSSRPQGKQFVLAAGQEEKRGAVTEPGIYKGWVQTWRGNEPWA